MYRTTIIVIHLSYVVCKTSILHYYYKDVDVTKNVAYSKRLYIYAALLVIRFVRFLQGCKCMAIVLQGTSPACEGFILAINALFQAAMLRECQSSWRASVIRLSLLWRHFVVASSESFLSKRLQTYAPLLASGIVSSYHMVASYTKHFITVGDYNNVYCSWTYEVVVFSDILLLYA